MNNHFESLREKMWENILSLTENYTGELLSNESLSAEDLSLNLSTGFDVLSGVLSEWVSAINLDVMDLNEEEHAVFVDGLLNAVRQDMIESFKELVHEDELENVYDRANKLINKKPTDD